VRLLLCDDHVLFLEVLQPVLERRGHVVDTSSCIDEALSRVSQDRHDVCVLDIGFPGTDGVAGARLLRAADPNLKIVMLTASSASEILREAVVAGACGLAFKGRPLAEAVETIERVERGDAVLDIGVLHAVVEPRAEHSEARLARFLTPRELEVLARLVQGEGTTEIARSLSVSKSTARTHIQSILTKLGVHSRLEACAFAVRHRIVDLPKPRDPVPG
jgi:two-component system, NarL family, nitrate/nitrite response regulator NarL